MVRESFGSLGLALAAILGVNPQIVTYLSTLFRNLDYKLQSFVNQMTHHQSRLPILLQRYVQVQLNQWYQDQGRSTVPLDFGLKRVVVLASTGMYNWVATLPHHLTTSTAVGPRPVAPPPVFPPAATRGKGKVRCLPFHLKGHCNSGCGSLHNHHNRHNSAKQARLLEWGTLHWVSPS